MAPPALAVQQPGLGAVSADNLNTFEQTCDSLANLRAFTGISGIQVYMRGYVSPGDGGQGNFYWNATSIAADNGGVTTIAPTGQTGAGRWIRLPPIGAGGSNGQIQWNNQGVIDGMVGSVWSPTLQNLSLTALSGGGTNATRSVGLTLNAGASAFDVGLRIARTRFAYSGLDIEIDATSGGSGQFLRLWQNIGGTMSCATYFAASGLLATRTGVLISGAFSPNTPVPGQAQSISQPSNDPNMLGVVSDVFGPAIQVKSNYPGNIGGYSYSALDGTGLYRFSIESSGTIGWGVGTRAQQDLWLGRGGAAVLNLGGANVTTPTAQTLTASSVTNAIVDNGTYVNGGAAAGTVGPITFGGAELSSAIGIGATVQNLTVPGSIAGGTTVASINYATYQITLSAAILAPGIAVGDQLQFTVPNATAPDLTIAGPKGTGSGAGGSLRLKVAPAGASGAAQNALVDALVLNSLLQAVFSGSVTATDIVGSGAFSSAAPVSVSTSTHTTANSTTVLIYSAACTETLPAAASYPGRELRLVTQGANAIISASANVVPITGGAAGTAILAATGGLWALLKSNGTNWVIIAAK